jgi:hypothetical protein
MTWSDLPDDENVRLRGTRDHAANLNAFTVASADRQWVYRPGTSPPIDHDFRDQDIEVVTVTRRPKRL